jgi:hypothetical protein
MRHPSWTNDWSAFVSSVCHDLDVGLSDQEITRRYAFQRVSWEGVAEKSNEVNGGRLLAIDMPTVRFQLKDGRSGFASRIVLFIGPDSIHDCDDVYEGDRIRFHTEIDMPSPDDPFTASGIEWSDLGNHTGYLKILTRNSQVIEILKP